MAEEEGAVGNSVVIMIQTQPADGVEGWSTEVCVVAGHAASV
jgi:hypothetical protein